MSKVTRKPRPVTRPVPKTDTDSDSLSSSFFTWHTKHRPPLLYTIQTGQQVAASEFYLFFASIILLALAAGLIVMSVWNIVFKLPFALLIDTSTELACFTLPGAILCLPCFWIVLSVHNDPKSYRFLSLVLLLLTFSIILMIIAVYVGFTHKLRSLNDVTVKESEFRHSMLRSLDLYEKHEKTRNAWDKIQSAWFCCGVNNFSDWFHVRPTFPDSCCRQNKVACRDNNSPSSHGCLKIIITILALQTGLFNGINCVALFIMCCTLIAVASVYFSSKRNEEE